MKSSLKQWRRLALGLMLAWVLLFLALFSYFMDSRVEEPRAASTLLGHAESRRLASVSGSIRGGGDGGHQHHVIMGSPRLDLHPRATASAARVPLASISATTTAAAASKEQRPGASLEPGQQPPSREQLSRETAYYSPDPQSLAAWSAFGTQDVGSRSAPRSRENRLPEEDEEEEEWRQQQQEEEEAGREEVEEEEEEGEVVGSRRRTRRTTTAAPARAPAAGRWEASDDLEEYYFSKSKSVVQRLWQGRVSAGMLSPRLQKAMKDYLSANKHRVAYGGTRQERRNAQQLMCQLKRHVRVRTLDGSEAPFSGWRSLVPKRPLERLYGSGFGSCAVVTSAGAILHSGLGKEIDSHDAVLRFNAAPTVGYERDVGNKTTIRIINSQILANPKHQFNSSSLYKNVTLVAWDPAPYAVNLHKWYMSPDYNLFSPYVEHRKHFPAQPFYILHPRFIWQLWDVIQGNTLENIQPNPPSSGFIGILLMMALCEEVHVYEYIPSVRQTDLCHYHERYFDAACTLGAYHPLLYEKMLVQRINTGPARDLRTKGKVTLPGFSTVQCDP
ncbi:beta-galactoside alpha-2,6-sialyltransferase 2 [Alosa sapidissima]|uniref:beta-galactoside alpha-2,6-sialyltransferase 2 n=1 Tax=Alosa sapidissima TaxID=34773 RepID=UPI001C08BF10|nr:beta-galactoside alpha-2,6-sialyltransferase 2 [Alosa sapidissima]XP_041931825.1 beta-galactoside alpha-2,6-sialyltransferase 2 [Alosa sapidissima]XP_041931833.1 beta-galactoside alpha-2,6-sialyltransferase 2 [Alosa sapidissima]